MRPLLGLAFSCALVASAPAQTTWYVDLAAPPPGDGSPASPYVSIQQAIAAPATLDGDTVLVAPGDYRETLDFLSKDLVVRASAGPLQTTLRPTLDGDPSVVTMGEVGMPSPPAELEGFTVTRYVLSARGVTVLPGSGGLLRRCIVTGHASGLFNNYDLFLEECTVTRNTIGIAGDSLGVHALKNTICKGNFTSDMTSGVFGPCYGAFYSDFDPSGMFECGTSEGNIDLDPLFWDAAGGDFRLRSGSPCIDTGDPAMLDPDGTRRDMGALPYDPTWAPGTSTTCFGDALACPCGNGSSGDGGCDIPQATGGIELAIVNFAPDGSGGGTAQFAGSAYSPTGTPGSTLIRSPALEASPVPFGDGLRCVAAAGVVRVGAVLASGGTSLHQVSHGAGPGTFHYQVWVRSLPATFCTPAPFNLSNVVSVTW